MSEQQTSVNQMRLQIYKHYKNVLKTDPQLLEDLSDLGWEYTCGRLSRSGMEVYDKIMIKLGVLEPLEHWNEDCYADANGDW